MTSLCPLNSFSAGKVLLSSGGTFLLPRCHLYGGVTGVTLPEDFSLERSMDAVETKAGEMWSAAAASDGAASSAPDFEVLRDTCCLVRTEKGKLALAADVNVARKDANLKDRVTMLMIID